MTTIGLLILLLIGGEEPFRFEAAPIEPRPQSVPLPEPEKAKEQTEPPADSAGNAATGPQSPGAHDGRHAPADPRPVVKVYTVRPQLCKPCEQYEEWWLANCDTARFNFELVEHENFDKLPQWVREAGVPLLHFDGQGRKWCCPWRGIESFTGTWRRVNPGVTLAAATPKLTSASPFDQIAKFTGPGGRFTFQPDAPVSLSLDDRTSLRYPSIQGRYTVENGVVTLKLDPPLPVGNYRKFLNFGFTITGAAGPENVTATTADVRIDTNRGPQRVTIQMEPVK